ncbi:MAG: hypothetical protein B6241_09645 [Spirochaetaceae bacterium 4572_59]|nr:MAG: hypothetical protein B6241_09645 [Spirochaetaceae bacterium 4572_59]
MKTIKLLLVCLLFTQSWLWAGGSQESTPADIEERIDLSLTITDSLGRTLILPKMPERIVQAGAFAFIINDALFLFPEAKERVVAMADSNQGRGFFLPIADTAYDKKIIMPRSVNIEEILAAAPDLVILKDFHYSKYDKEFQKVGIPVIYLNLESPEAWENDLDILGAIFDNTDRVKELKDLFSAYAENVSAPLMDLKQEDRKKSLVLYYSEKDGSGAFQVPPLTFIQAKMLTMAGSDPVWGDADIGTRWTKVGFEQIAAWNPDQIFLISYRTSIATIMDTISNSAYWQELRAFKEGEIHPFPMDFHSWDQPDPRWLLGLQWLAGQAHPELFPDLDMNKRAETFFADFYGISSEDYRNKILPASEGILP